ncbi:MAG: glycine--tRNA ligase [Candidatus Hodarchaeales archaeon]
MKIDKEMKEFLEKIMAYANRTGIAFMSGNIYGGFAGFWDYGPIGVEIKNKIKDAWWNDFVRNREDIVGYDGAIITHPKVWEASGHLTSFNDPLVLCQGKCQKKHRLDHLLEDHLNISVESLSIAEMEELVKENNITCPICGGSLSKPVIFNLMFSTQVGPVKDSSSIAYLRPENAQLIFSGFKNVIDSTRIKMPFGIAQSGIVFRNEISPRNFLFRVREYELMEFEYFTNPTKINECPYYSEIENFTLNLIAREEQELETKLEYRKMTVGEAWSKKIFKNKWQAYWLVTFIKWFTKNLALTEDKLRLRQHLESELSHYALDTWDIEYRFPFGWKELLGCANRTQYDLEQHQKHSKIKMEFMEDTGKGVERFVPYVVAEPSVGLGRILLALLADGYLEETVKGRKRVVLKIHPRIAPYDAAVFPLQKKDPIIAKAKKITQNLREKGLIIFYDESGSIGKRYRRQDEIGTPSCITVDFETIQDEMVTIRNRDTMGQVRIPINEVANELLKAKQIYQRK